MKVELLLVIIILSVIAISSLFFSIWNLFVTKKQTTFSATDLFYGMIFGIFAGVTTNIYIMLTTLVILIIWFIVIGIKVRKNQKEKNKN